MAVREGTHQNNKQDEGATAKKRVYSVFASPILTLRVHLVNNPVPSIYIIKVDTD